MRRLGPPARALWLMHEPPIGPPIAGPLMFDQTWGKFIERFSPRLTVSGHDHFSPIRNGVWNCRLGKTLCVNVGQAEFDLHYALADFEFPEPRPSLPTRITVRAFPWGQAVVV
jgi:Icc-related predicted phosphoesterase